MIIMDDAQKLSALLIQNQSNSGPDFLHHGQVGVSKENSVIVLPRSSCCQYLEVPATILILQFNLVSQRKGESKEWGKNESLNLDPLISIGSMGTAKTVGMIEVPSARHWPPSSGWAKGQPHSSKCQDRLEFFRRVVRCPCKRRWSCIQVVVETSAGRALPNSGKFLAALPAMEHSSPPHVPHIYCTDPNSKYCMLSQRV